MCPGPVGAGRRHRDCRVARVDAPSANRGTEGCPGREGSFFARWPYAVLREISTLRVDLGGQIAPLPQLAYCDGRHIARRHAQNASNFW